MSKRPAAPPATPTVRTVQFEVAPSPDAREGLTLAQQATALKITNRETHADALEFARGLKQLKRKIEDHWSRITRTVDDLKRNLLTLKREDLDPVERALEIVTSAEVAFRNERDRLERIEQDRLRREAEEKAAAERQRQAEPGKLWKKDVEVAGIFGGKIAGKPSCVGVDAERCLHACKIISGGSKCFQRTTKLVRFRPVLRIVNRDK